MHVDGGQRRPAGQGHHGPVVESGHRDVKHVGRAVPATDRGARRIRCNRAAALRNEVQHVALPDDRTPAVVTEHAHRVAVAQLHDSVAGKNRVVHVIVPNSSTTRLTQAQVETNAKAAAKKALLDAAAVL